MKILVKIFPTAGLADKTIQMEIDLKAANISELLSVLHEKLGTDPAKIETLNFMHNGRMYTRHEDLILKDGDQIWLLPKITGG